MPRPARDRVTAVVVGSSSSEFLPTTLAALAAQTTAPTRVVVGRLDDDAVRMRGLLGDAGLQAEVVDVSGAQSLGEAVTTAVPQDRDDGGWLWLLHDDSAPEPGALAALTQATEAGRSVAVAGAKQVSWSHPDRLVSVGASYTRDLQRYTGIEDGEVDQGQHDDRDDIDAVGTAGMLVDAEVFAALGGPDPALGPFGDGRDLSRRARLAGHRVVVVPRAVVRHARAGYLGTRRDPAHPDPRRSFRARRTAVLHARMSEAPAALVPLIALLALLMAPVRAVGRLLTKELPLIVDELLAPLAALAGLPGVVRARRRAKATRRVSRSRLRPLAASWRDVARVRRDRRMQASTQRRTRRAPSELEMRERAALALRRRGWLALVLVATVAIGAVTLAPRVLQGPLVGGALLPVDGGFAELWRAVSSPWLASGDGLGLPADPFLGVLGVLSAVTGGPLGTPVWVTIGLVLAAAVPLSALSAWFAAGAATRALALRVWASITWAVGPPLLLALTQGMLGPVVAHVLLPLVALALARAFGLDRRDVVVSGMVGARRATGQAVVAAPTAEVRRRRLAALSAVADDAPTGQIARVLAGEDTAARGIMTVRLPDDDAGRDAGDDTLDELAADDDPESAVDLDDADLAALDAELAGLEGDDDEDDAADDEDVADDDGDEDAAEDAAADAAAGDVERDDADEAADAHDAAAEEDESGAEQADEADGVADVADAGAAETSGTAAETSGTAEEPEDGVETVADASDDEERAATPTGGTPVATVRRRRTDATRSGRGARAARAAVEEEDEELPPSVISRPSGVGSIGAAAAAGIGLAAAAAGAPVLLPAGLLVVLLLAIFLGRRRSLVVGRKRLLLVVLPSLVVFGPLLVHALGTPGGWRLLLATPGAVVASDPVEPWLGALAWPAAVPAAGLWDVLPWLAWIPTGTAVLAALVALLRGGSRARAVRLAWLVAVIGLAASLLAPHVATGIARTADGTDVVAHAWAGAGSSLLLLGLLMATAVAADGLRTALGGRSFGWRQLGIAVMTLVLGLGAVVGLAGGAGTLSSGDELATRTSGAVPAIGAEVQGSSDRGRVLALSPGPGGAVDAELWRGAGPQLTETSTAAALDALDRAATDAGRDPAEESLAEVVAALATGTAVDAGPLLADHAVAVVVVPPLDSVVSGGHGGSDVSRDRLVALLDGVLGLERVTENATGVVWRVAAADAATPVRVTLVPSDDGEDATVRRVPSDPVSATTEIDSGAAATLVIAERRDPSWRARVDGVPLRSVALDWRQAFAVPAGTSGELVVRYEPPLALPWQLAGVAVLVVVGLIAVPTRRRRLEEI